MTSYLRQALDNVSAYVYIKDHDSRYLYANKKTLELFNCSEQSLLGRSDKDFFPADTAVQLRQLDLRVLAGECTEEEIISTDPQGRMRIYWEVKSAIHDDTKPDQVVGLLGISTDITERKKLEEENKKAALTDALTGLPNRRMLFEHLIKAQGRSKRNETHGALLFLDLNKLKQLNDMHGHEVGDLLLIEVAHRLRIVVREIDTVSRLGGDEFVVVLENLDANSQRALVQAEDVATKIRNALKKEYILDGVRHNGSASIGISLFFRDDQSIDQILSESDARMYEIKRTGIT